MNLTMLLDMVVEGMPDRVLIGDRADGLTASELARRARSGSDLVRAADAGTVVYLGGNGPAFPVALFAAASVGVPFLPVNYRLSDEQLDDVLGRQAKPLVITDSPERVRGMAAVTLEEFARPTDVAADHDDRAPPTRTPTRSPCCSTPAAPPRHPKAAVLRHRHLTSYVLGSVEFGGAGRRRGGARERAAVPRRRRGQPAVATSTPGRRIVYLDHVRRRRLARRVRDEGITHAMVVPTMLARIVDVLDARRRAALPDAAVAVLRRRAMPHRCCERALALLPDVGFVNAYGLTETSSTIAVLGPDDHRGRPRATTRRVRARLGSVGRRRCPASRSRSATPTATPLPAGRARARSGCAGEQVVGRVRRPAAAARRRRLVPHPRPRLARRRRLPVHRGPRRRHDHPRRREHRPRRDRGRAR